MDYSDISIVKEENFELIIKTEPQINNEFYMFGESQIKTEEESNSAGDINDTINYEAHCAHTSNVTMKSPWDDFLPIKEQIKDESDASNYEDGIMKTQENKFQIKQEQDQSTSSSEILRSNLLVQASSDFNFKIDCVRENQELSFNVVHKKEDYSNILVQRLCCESLKNTTSKCKTTNILNLVQIEENSKSDHAENICKIHSCSNNYVTSGNFKDNELNQLSCRHAQSEGFCISLRASNSKCKSGNCTKNPERRGRFPANTKFKTENYTNEAEVGHSIENEGRRECKTNYTKQVQVEQHCRELGGRKIYEADNCTNHAQVGEHCIKHGGGSKCKIYNCSNYACVGRHCSAHAGGKRCKTKNCTKHAHYGGHCFKHEDCKKCKTKNCTKYAQYGGHCVSHGGGKKCKTQNCTKYAQYGGHCVSHGGGRICKIENCTKKGTIGGLCFVHGRGKCIIENCINQARLGGPCIAHGGRKLCTSENCTKFAKIGGHCFAHGGFRKCITDNCSKLALVGNYCIGHGGGGKCKIENCTKYAQEGGHCVAHGGGRKCKIENCTRLGRLGGLCKAHGGGKKCLILNCTKKACVGGRCFTHGERNKCNSE